jgi:hypothetical protein
MDRPGRGQIVGKMTAAIIEARDLVKRFDGFTAVDHISFVSHGSWPAEVENPGVSRGQAAPGGRDGETAARAIRLEVAGRTHEGAH